MVVKATGMRTKATVVEGIKPCCYHIKKIKIELQKPAAMDSCLGLVMPHQHGTAIADDLWVPT